MRILVIEDDAQAAQYLTKGLRESGFVVDHAPDGPQGLFLATSETYDAMIVDRMLPGMDGLLIVETIRRNGNQTPVLFLSALSEVGFHSVAMSRRFTKKSGVSVPGRSVKTPQFDA